MHDAEQIERWQIWRELTDAVWRLWEDNLESEEIERRMAIWRREHDLSDANMLRAMRE